MGKIIFRNLQGNPHTPIDTSTGEVLVRKGATINKKQEYENLPSANKLVENYEKKFGEVREPKEQVDKTKKYTDIKNKRDLIDFVKHQTGYDLENDPDDFLNKSRSSLYTKIPRERKNQILGLLDKYGFRHEDHIKDYYWISVRSSHQKQ